MAEKIAIITDSNSGISQSEAKTLGITVIPMPFIIDEKEYQEDINLTVEQFYEKLRGNAEVSTSQPTVSTLLDLWDELLKTHDTVVHIPMSSGLSGSCATAMALSFDYTGKVFVVDNQRISVTLLSSVLEAKKMADEGKSAAEIREQLTNVKFDSSIYIMLDTLKYLKKGGRVTAAAATIATVLRIKPVLQIQGEKLDAFAKARSEKQARTIMIDAIKSDVDKRFGGFANVELYIAHTDNLDAANEFANEVEDALGMRPCVVAELSLSVSCHIGPGSLALACAKK